MAKIKKCSRKRALSREEAQERVAKEVRRLFEPKDLHDRQAFKEWQEKWERETAAKDEDGEVLAELTHPLLVQAVIQRYLALIEILAAKGRADQAAELAGEGLEIANEQLRHAVKVHCPELDPEMSWRVEPCRLQVVKYKDEDELKSMQLLLEASTWIVEKATDDEIEKLSRADLDDLPAIATAVEANDRNFFRDLALQIRKDRETKNTVQRIVQDKSVAAAIKEDEQAPLVLRFLALIVTRLSA